MSGTLVNDDCLTALREIEADSLDALVTDPPAGIAFMGKLWDHDHGGREGWVKAFAAMFSECYRVLKPGAHGLVWALPRTSHWTATALEDAGFEVRDVVTHHFGTGFPKSLDVSKAIDKAAGAEREVVGVSPNWRESKRDREKNGSMEVRGENAGQLTGPPITDDAERWQGWGTALKPASEHWILVRKPLSEKNVAANVLAHGTGALNIDGCRIEGVKGVPASPRLAAHGGQAGGVYGEFQSPPTTTPGWDPQAGRWPANLVLSHSPDCRQVGTRSVKGSSARLDDSPSTSANGFGPGDSDGWKGTWHKHGPAYGTVETVETYECVEGCPVAELDRQSGTLKSGFMAADTQRSTEGGYMGGFPVDRVGARDTYGDSGGASRFFYVAKASTAERNAGLGEGTRNTLGPMAGRGQPGLKCRICGRWKVSGNPCVCPEPDWEQSNFERPKVVNHHPTVKAVALMRYLCRLVTPPGGWVLDPFMGSGSTGVAAVLEGFNFYGIEREQDYFEIAKARILDAAR